MKHVRSSSSNAGSLPAKARCSSCSLKEETAHTSAMSSPYRPKRQRPTLKTSIAKSTSILIKNFLTWWKKHSKRARNHGTSQRACRRTELPCTPPPWSHPLEPFKQHHDANRKRGPSESHDIPRGHKQFSMQRAEQAASPSLLFREEHFELLFVARLAKIGSDNHQNE